MTIAFGIYANVFTIVILRHAIGRVKWTILTNCAIKWTVKSQLKIAFVVVCNNASKQKPARRQCRAGFSLPMTYFPLPSQAIHALESVPTNDTRRFVFDQPVFTRANAGTLPARSFVAIDKPLSKRTAKHDKLAVRASRDGIKPFKAPDYAARNAGLVGTIH